MYVPTNYGFMHFEHKKLEVSGLYLQMRRR